MVGSIDFPGSFPLDVMHVLYQNLMKQLLSLWEGTYKSGRSRPNASEELANILQLNEDASPPYVISSDQWKQMDKDIADATKLTPAQLAPSLANITMRGYWNADSYSYFMIHLAPILLRHRLPADYYEHYVRLARLVRPTTQVEITGEEVAEIEEGYIAWVEDFER
jgi:hypothetical protein